MSPDPPSRHAKHALITSWNPPFQILDPPLIVIDYLHIPLQRIVPPQKKDNNNTLPEVKDYFPFEQACKTHEHLYVYVMKYVYCI